MNSPLLAVSLLLLLLIHEARPFSLLPPRWQHCPVARFGSTERTTNTIDKQGESSSSSSTQQQRVVVVGGGVGGLVIASRIASAAAKGSLNNDVEVTILEKNDELGGRCGSFDVVIPAAGQQQQGGTFRHERGPSLLLLPDVYRQVFTDCSPEGQTMEDFGLQIKQCVPAYKVIFDDGDSIDLGFPSLSSSSSADDATMIPTLERQSRETMNRFEVNGATKWDEYMRACEAFLDCGLPNFIEERLDLVSFPAFLREALRDLGKAWPLKPHSDVLDAIFQSNKMKAMASFQDLYVGLEPYRNNQLVGGGVLDSTAPAVFGLLAAIELHPTNQKCGVFAPVGGFRAVTDALEKLAESLGVVVKCGKTVVSVTNDGVYFTGGQNEDEVVFEPADLVIVNADLPYATKTLIDHERQEAPRYDWDDKYRFSCGVIAFHWSLSQELDELNTHNVFMSTASRQHAEASWKVLRDSGGEEGYNLSFTSVDQPFNFYVHRASKTDSSAAPEGMDSILVLVPCKALSRIEAFASRPGWSSG